jgi:hypothetical protein
MGGSRIGLRQRVTLQPRQEGDNQDGAGQGRKDNRNGADQDPWSAVTIIHRANLSSTVRIIPFKLTWIFVEIQM